MGDLERLRARNADDRHGGGAGGGDGGDDGVGEIFHGRRGLRYPLDSDGDTMAL